jgi:hypothetical protein
VRKAGRVTTPAKVAVHQDDGVVCVKCAREVVWIRVRALLQHPAVPAVAFVDLERDRYRGLPAEGVGANERDRLPPQERDGMPSDESDAGEGRQRITCGRVGDGGWRREEQGDAKKEQPGVQKIFSAFPWAAGRYFCLHAPLPS